MSVGRRELLTAIRKLCATVHNARYFTKRGPIDWASFPFDRHPFGCAILCDDTTLFRRIDTAVVTLQLAAKLPDYAAKGPEIDDGLADEFYDDVRWVLTELRKQRDERGQPVAISIGTESARVVEFHDADLLVQGVLVTIPIDF